MTRSSHCQRWSEGAGPRTGRIWLRMNFWKSAARAKPSIIGLMFFRRKTTNVPTFQARLENLRRSGFTVIPQSVPQSGGSHTDAVRVSRGDFARDLNLEKVDVTDESGVVHRGNRAGRLIGDEIGVLTDSGFQKFFLTPSGKRKPALAEELKGLHDFEEDLKEGLVDENL